MSLQIINPIRFHRWDELLLENDDYSFFHSSYWAKVLNSSYQYKPLYFSVVDNGKISVLVPIMEINSSLTGKRGVSLPFTDYSSPIVSNGYDFKEIFHQVIQYGKNAGWKYIEFRGGKDQFSGMQPSSSFFIHTLDLQSGKEAILSSMRRSTERNIKKAEKENVHVERHVSLESVREFYRLNSMTRKNHGLPPQPYYFFRNIYEYIISKGKGFVLLAKYRSRYIAGAVFFNLGDKAIFKYGASDQNYLYLRPNNIVIWSALKWYMENGFKSFSFGRTDLENKGLLQYKRGWGGKEEAIGYYKYNFKKDVFVGKPIIRNSITAYILRKIPYPMLKKAGSLFYRHMG